VNISLSELDKQRFGIVTAKTSFDVNENVNEALSWCDEKKVELLITRIPTEKIALAQELEQAGFFLADTLVYFRNKHILDTEIKLPENYKWRVATPADAEAVEKFAEKSFAGYGGHYHADPRLNKADCDLVYSSWAANSCRNNDFADVVYLITHEDAPIGFATIKIIDTDMAEVVLSGVHPDYQGKGIYLALISLAKKWAIQRQLTQLILSTQVTNLAVQKVWCRLGFEPYKSFYTFHKWFTE
jgi:GNAT superfamily N-acetyltransferase